MKKKKKKHARLFFFYKFSWKEKHRVAQLTFLADKRQGPCENVHEIGQPVGMRRTVELPNIHHVVLVL